MRRRAAAVRSVKMLALLAIGGIALSTTSAGAALSPTFPATRIKLDPAGQQVNLFGTASPASTTLIATVLDWHGNALPSIAVHLSVLNGPDKGLAQNQTTDKTGLAKFTYTNRGGPGTDVVQATFADGLEVHKSNRPFVTWLSGQPATAIPSPAVINLSPPCFQPLSAVSAGSDVFRGPAPQASPQGGPSAGAPLAEPTAYAITVAGDNFNPFTDILLTFDAAPGGRPNSFQTRSDGFGHFSGTITPPVRVEGPYLVRADDLREREASATFTVPCFQPSVALDPPIGPPGFVSLAVGSGFPANSPLTIGWDSPALRSKPQCRTRDSGQNPVTDQNGAFQCEVLVFYHDRLGPRTLSASVPNPYGAVAGSAILVQAPFFVTPGREQPPDFTERR